MAKGALSAGTVSLSVQPDTKGFGASLKKGVMAESSGLGSAGKLLGGAVLAGVGAAGAVMLKNFATGAVNAFAAVEDATGAASVVFGKSLPIVLDFADKAGSAFGLSKRQAIEAQNTFATLGKAAGLAGDPLAGFATKLTGLAGDLASFKGTSTEQAIQAVGAALRGETEPIRAYGVLLDDSTLRLQAVKMGLIKTVKEGLNPSQKALAAQAAILAQTKDAQGDYNRTSTSTANVQKTLAAETENAQAALGQKLAPAVTAIRILMLGFVKNLSGAIDVVVALGSKVKDLASFIYDNRAPILVVAGVITAVFIPALIKLAVQAAISGAKTVASWVMIQASAIASTAKTVAQFVIQGARWVWLGAQAMANAAKIAAAWLISMGPIALVGAAVIALVVVIVKNWDKIREGAVAPINGVLKIFQYMTNGIIAAVNLIIRAWNLLPFKKDIKTLTNVEFPQLANAASSAAEKIAGAIKKASGGKVAKGLGETIGGPIADAVAPSSSPVVAKTAKEIAKAVSSLTKYKATVTKIYGKMNTEIASFLVKKSEIIKAAGLREIAIQSQFNDKINQLNQAAATARAAIVQKSIDLLTGAFSSATKVDVGSLFSASTGLGGLLDSLKTKLFGAQSLSKNAAALAAQGYSQTFIQQVVSQGPDIGNSMAKAILDATPEAADQLKDLFLQINDVSDNGVTALAKSMNSGAKLATQALMDEYAKVGTDLKVVLADAQKDLADALLASSAQFNDDMDKLQTSTMAKMAALQASLKETADAIAKISGAPAGAKVIANAPKLPKIVTAPIGSLDSASAAIRKAAIAGSGMGENSGSWNGATSADIAALGQKIEQVTSTLASLPKSYQVAQRQNGRGD